MNSRKNLMRTFYPMYNPDLAWDGKTKILYSLNATEEDEITYRINYFSISNFFFLNNPRRLVKNYETIDFKKEGAFVGEHEIGVRLRYGGILNHVPQPKNLRNFKTLQLFDPDQIEKIQRKGCRLYVDGERAMTEVGFLEHLQLKYHDNDELLSAFEKNYIQFHGDKIWIKEREVVRAHPYKQCLQNTKKSTLEDHLSGASNLSLDDLAETAAEKLGAFEANLRPKISLPSVDKMLSDAATQTFFGRSIPANRPRLMVEGLVEDVTKRKGLTS